MNVTIRKAELSDAQGMIEVLNPIIRQGGLTLMTECWDEKAQTAYLRDFPKKGVFLVALNEDKRLVGMQGVEPWSDLEAFAHVGDISTFVALDCWGEGIGKKLAKTLFLQAATVGFRKLMALVRGDNPAAQSFYKSIGFVEVGCLKEQALLEGRYVDEVLLERSLVEPQALA